MTKPVFKIKLLPGVIAILAGGAAFQTACAADAQQPPAAQSQANEAQTTVVEVTGIRDTLKKNLATKRDNTNVMDSVSAEDIGKFPDKNVGDALERVPGVSVENVLGVNRDVFIRGTNKDLNMALLNGQDVASAYWWANDKQSRGFSFDILPSEIIASMDVYKSPSADQSEGSIGGLINIKTRKPLQFKDQITAQFSLEDVYSELPKKSDPQLSGMVNWKNDEKTFGVLIGINDQRQHLQRNGLENFTDGASQYNIVNAGTGAVTDNVMAAWGGGTPIFQQDRKRTTENLVFEIKPNNRTDISASLLNTNMNLDNSNQNYLWLWGGVASPNGVNNGTLTVTNPNIIQTPTGPALIGGTVNTAGTGATVNGYPIGGNLAFEPIFRKAFVDSQVYDVDGTYRGDGWNFHGQAGATNARGGSDHDYDMWFGAPSSITTDTSNDHYGVTYNSINPNDPSVLNLQSAHDNPRRMKTTENYGQADLTFDLNNAFLKDVKVGAKFSSSTNSNTRMAGTDGPGNTGWQSFSLAQVSSGSTGSLNNEPGALQSFAMVNPASFWNVVAPMYAKGMVYIQDWASDYSIDEKITAAYAMSDIEWDRLRGNFGLRFIRTSDSATGYQQLEGATAFSPVTVDHTYNDVLPSLNLVYDLRNDLILRAAASRAMARPDWSQLSPALTPNGTITNNYSGGNPLLKPYHSNQAEIGFEWYYADSAMLSLTAFVKRLDTFIYTASDLEMVNGVLSTVTHSLNANSGASINGLEAQWQQPIGGGFGVVTNLTLTDAKSNATQLGQPAEVVGNSRTYFNFSTYYERAGFSARISYNYRSKTYGAFDEGGQDITSPYGQWDANASYDINKNLSVFLTAVNINDELVRTNTTAGIPVGQYENGARYSIGLRGKF
ncbi:MAG TPA: TonB-dependent receptor [Burkholderiaceae bacterium]